MKMKINLLLPDIHHPHHNKPSINGIKKLCEDIKFDGLILPGDNQNFDAIDHWKKEKGKHRSLEGKRLKKEYAAFDQDVLTPFEKLIKRRAEKVYMFGNHEAWVDEAIDKNPQGEGYWEIDNNLHLTKRGWKIVPYPQIYKLGKLRIIHGVYTNQYHAKKTVEAYERNIAYGHCHTCQSFTKVTPERESHSAHCLGCLCDLNPDYMRGRPNKWTHGFGIVYLWENGFYNLYRVFITNGKFVWNGKLYDGNK